MNKKNTKKRQKKIISEDERLKLNHMKDIRATMDHIGFRRLKGIENHNFTYHGRQTELDDIFIYENLILLVEYTSNNDPSKHLTNKMYFYDFIDKSYIDFIDFMLNEPELKSFKDYYDKYLHNVTIQPLPRTHLCVPSYKDRMVAMALY